jgi:hypothetical protein
MALADPQIPAVPIPAVPSAAPEPPDTTHYLAERLRTKRRWPHRVKDAHFGHPTVSELADLHARLGAAVRDQVLKGAPVHRRLPGIVRQVPWVVALLDFVVLLSFCGDVFNVNPLHPGPSPLAAVAAVMLAMLGSGVGYTWLAMTGMRIKAFRTEMGEVAWRAVGALTWTMIGVAAVLIAALAMLMYGRVATEMLAQIDGSAAAGAGALAMIFAVLSVVANLAVIAVHALDGSWVMAELERAGRLLHQYEQLPRPRSPHE